MPIREFTDSAGVQWRVWETTPWAGAVYDQRMKAGWLTFESAAARRRLAPVPDGWEDVPIERLEAMCHAAEPVKSLTPDPDAPRHAPSDDSRSDVPDRK